MIKIIPAILPEDFDALEADLALVSGVADIVQIDVTDGRFVPNTSWPYDGQDEEFQNILQEKTALPEWDKLDYEIDLMVEAPEEAVNEWITAGARRIVVHIESTTEPALLIKQFRLQFAKENSKDPLSVELGLAINLATDVHILDPYIVDIDFVQCMGIDKVGFQGQPFNEKVIERVADLHNRYPELAISVDGGVNLENAKKLADAGASRLIVGSALLNAVDIKGTLKEFQEVVQ